MAVSQAHIIESLERACSKLNPDEFIFDFLDAYGFPKSTITRLRNGGDSRNVGTGGDIGLKKKLYFRVVPVGQDVTAEAESLKDGEGKPHAQFTNLIAQPDAEDDDVKVSVNNMLKAITVSLLMEQVLAPSVNFKPRSRMLPGEVAAPGTVIIEDTAAPISDKVIKALENMDNIKAAILQEPEIMAPAVTGEADPEILESVEIPKIVEKLYPDLEPSEVMTVSEAVHASLGIQSTGGLFDEDDLPEGAEIMVPPGMANEHGATETGQKSERPGDADPKPNRKFVLIGNKFVNIEHLNIDLIRQINPFQGAYEILSKAVTPAVLKTIQETVVGMRSNMSEAEAVVLWPRILEFRKEKNREPSVTSGDATERRLAEALVYVKRKAQERKAQAQES